MRWSCQWGRYALCYSCCGSLAASTC